MKPVAARAGQGRRFGEHLRRRRRAGRRRAGGRRPRGGSGSGAVARSGSSRSRASPSPARAEHPHVRQRGAPPGARGVDGAEPRVRHGADRYVDAEGLARRPADDERAVLLLDAAGAPLRRDAAARVGRCARTARGRTCRGRAGAAARPAGGAAARGRAACARGSRRSGRTAGRAASPPRGGARRGGARRSRAGRRARPTAAGATRATGPGSKQVARRRRRAPSSDTSPLGEPRRPRRRVRVSVALAEPVEDRAPGRRGRQRARGTRGRGSRRSIIGGAVRGSRRERIACPSSTSCAAATAPSTPGPRRTWRARLRQHEAGTRLALHARAPAGARSSGRAACARGATRCARSAGSSS